MEQSKLIDTLETYHVPCLLLPSALDAQFGTPYPRSAGFDTDTRPRDSQQGHSEEDRGDQTAPGPLGSL